MESIKEIYDNYAKLVYHYMFSITRELSEEIMQETFVIAINQINKFKGIVKFLYGYVRLQRMYYIKKLIKIK